MRWRRGNIGWSRTFRGLRSLRSGSGKRVLEIGCGIGTDTVNFARNGAQVTSVDLSEKSLELAQQRIRVYGLQDQVKFYRGNAEELSGLVPVEQVRPDLFVWRDSSHAASGAGAGGAAEVCAAGDDGEGDGVSPEVVEGDGDFAGRRAGAILETAGAGGEEFGGADGLPDHVYVFAGVRGGSCWSGMGFAARKIEVEHIFPYRIADYVKYQYVREFYFRWMPEAMFRGAGEEAGLAFVSDGGGGVVFWRRGDQQPSAAFGAAKDFDCSSLLVWVGGGDFDFLFVGVVSQVRRL